MSEKTPEETLVGNASPANNNDNGASSSDLAAAFDEALDGFISTLRHNMDHCRLASELALELFITHGQIGPFQRLFDAMDVNYSRRQAYVTWGAAHAPIMMEKGSKFKKDTGKNAAKPDLAGAIAKPFWEFDPAPPITQFSADDIDKRLLGLIKSFESDTKTAKNNEAKVKLSELKKLAKQLAIGVTGNIKPQGVTTEQ